MWWFGIGLFLIEVTPNSLQLTATYGFTNGGALLLLSAVVGDIIDRTARLSGRFNRRSSGCFVGKPMTPAVVAFNLAVVSKTCDMFCGISICVFII